VELAGFRNNLWLAGNTTEFLSEFAAANSVLEDFNAVDEDNGNVILEALFQRSIFFDIDFDESEFLIAPGGQDIRLGFVAQMATGFRENCDSSFRHLYLEDRPGDSAAKGH
jgi:hypothetical protein